MRAITPEAEFRGKAGYLWLDRKDLFLPVPARKFQGGWSVVSGKKAPVYLTEHFLKKADIDRQGGDSFNVHTYRYYLPGQSPADQSRGSGRDHLIRYSDSKAPQEERLHSVKGSGTNEAFGHTNGTFNIEDFRANGLQPLTESLGEFIMAQQYAAAGIAVVPHTDFVILPRELQAALPAHGSIDPDFVAVQTHRVLRGGRESHGLVAPTEAMKANLVADLLFWNVGHGAINRENLSGLGELVDMGHTGFGAPVLSYQYRCTVCPSMRGGPMDGTVIGPLDHFYTHPQFDGVPRTGRNYFEDEVVDQIFNRIFGRLKGSSAQNVYSPELRRVFRALVEVKSNYRMKPVDYFGKTFWSQAIFPYFDALDSKFFKRPEARSQDYTDPELVGVSLRFTLQLAHLKRLYGDTWFRKNVHGILDATIENWEKTPTENLMSYSAAVEELRELMEANAVPLDVATRELFTEYRPMNVVLAEIREGMKEVRSFDQVSMKSQELYRRLSAPLVFDPKDWWSQISDALIESGNAPILPTR